MLNKSKQKNPTVAPAGFQEQNKLNFKLSVSRKAAKWHDENQTNQFNHP